VLNCGCWQFIFTDPAAQLRPAPTRRKAQWRLDFIAAENSMGFHTPEEATRILGEAIDYARQGEVAVARLAASRTRVAAASPPESPAAPKSP
jgi:nitrite reductase (cytochrome c-552)